MGMHISYSRTFSRKMLGWRQWVIILIDFVLFASTGNGGSNERGDTGLSIIRLIRRGEPLAPTSWKVNDKLRRHKTCNASPDLAFEIENCLEWRSKVFNPFNHIRLVDIVLIRSIG